MSRLAISKHTIATQVVEELRRRIIGGQVRAGEKLQQEQIAQELGVSRSPVREALRQLEAEGLVTLISQKGAEVAPISLAEVSEMFEMRLMLEPHLLQLAIPNLTEADFAAAAATIAAMEEADIAAWGVLNWELHRGLYEPAARPTILRTLDRIHQSIDRYLRMEMSMTQTRGTAKIEHEQLVSLCRRGQTDRAVSLLRIHILNALASLTDIVEADGGERRG
jgi:DNA-binding GntR family transcriptional regulator